jgi:hypothetical protein
MVTQQKIEKLLTKEATMKRLTVLASGLVLATGLAFAGDDADKQAFNELDTNQDGYVSAAEAAEDQAVMSNFQAADSNQDGFLTSTEYEQIKDETEESE